MNQLTSPDLPAQVCYLLVLVFGMWVAGSHLNRLLDSSPGRWGFFSTWILFLAHAVVPLALFWFLDYTNAIHDTALFAAAVVAVGYRQIFAGGVQGIMMPGQTPALWKPFEAWVERVRTHIVSKNILWRDRFNEKLRDHLSSDPARLGVLRALAFKYSKDKLALNATLAALAARPEPAAIAAAAWKSIQEGEETQALLQELRSNARENYGYFLYKNGLLTKWQYRTWLGDARAKGTAWAVAIGLALAIGFGCFEFNRSQAVQFRYYQWRFAKPNATERDRHRTREFFRKQFNTITEAGALGQLMEPLLGHLRFREVAPNLSKETIQMVMSFHSRPLNPLIIPRLIEALRTENNTIRLSVHQALKDLQSADYPQATISTNLLVWRPEQDAPPGEIDARVRAWQEWWDTAKLPPK